MKVALATCTELPHLDADEAHLVKALQAKGIEHVIAPWDGPDAPFLESDVAVIRSTWDYTQRVDEFVAWAARIELAMKAKGRELLNPSSVVRWNTHKRYLTELAQEKVAIVPTVIVDKGTKVDLKLLLTEHAWTGGAVVKPCVSAGSRDTVRIDGLAVDEAQALLDREGATRDMMVQPYVTGIEAGEVSLIFIDGALSHAVNKVPKDQDFRSQPEFGSDVKAVEASGEMRMRARDILSTVGGKLLYARVDFVKGDDGTPWLMELELVEPSLYLAWDEHAAAKLAEAIARRAGA
jgi:glutathione synthase/RimK-type ligase-like ATP-grasp enzyme